MTPDFVIEKFAASLGITPDELLRNDKFSRILYNQDSFTITDDLSAGVIRMTPIIYRYNGSSDNTVEPRSPAGGKGNFVVGDNGQIVEIRNKLGFLTMEFVKLWRSG